MDNRPIGVFDSGIGGLTVVKEIMNQLKNEKIIYFGDTARVPYGSKSKDTVIKYSHQIIRFLLTKEVKAIVIACNTASASALNDVRTHYDLPIIGVVEPGVKAAVMSSKNRRIGIIGTEGTILSGTYEKLIHNQIPEIKLFTSACPLFVPLVEEGWIDDPVTFEIAKRYLEVFNKQNIDALVLGCTHYPLLTEIIGKIMGRDVKLVNPAYETARALEELLTKNALRSETETPLHEFYVSDRALKFGSFAKKILKNTLYAEQIDIEAY